jgi:hypothetical protein
VSDFTSVPSRSTQSAGLQLAVRVPECAANSFVWVMPLHATTRRPLLGHLLFKRLNDKLPNTRVLSPARESMRWHREPGDSYSVESLFSLEDKSAIQVIEDQPIRIVPLFVRQNQIDLRIFFGFHGKL